jgi:hypothetical protein
LTQGTFTPWPGGRGRNLLLQLLHFVAIGALSGPLRLQQQRHLLLGCCGSIACRSGFL